MSSSSESADPNYSCPLCLLSFPSQAQRRHHETACGKRRGPKARLACKQCDYSTTHTGFLARHARSHAAKPLFECDRCPFVGKRLAHLELHLQAHDGIKSLTCDACGFRTTWRQHLKAHLVMHRGEPSLACDKCAFETTRKPDLVRHLATHVEVAFDCTYRAVTEDSLTPHSLAAHLKEIRSDNSLCSGPKGPGYVCVWCRHATSSFAELITHLAEHADVSQNVCAESETAKSGLPSDTEAKPFVRKDFIVGTTSLHDLRRHAPSDSGDWCVHCGRSFRSKLSLAIHVRVHRGTERGKLLLFQR